MVLSRKKRALPKAGQDCRWKPPTSGFGNAGAMKTMTMTAAATLVVADALFLRLKTQLSAHKQRETVELLAADRRGATEALMLAEFTCRSLTGLVPTHCATAPLQVSKADGKTVKIDRFRVNKAGRQGIEGGR